MRFRLCAAAVAALLIAGSSRVAGTDSTGARALRAQPAATAKGLLTVGTAKFALAHVSVVPDRPAADAATQSYRIFVTDRRLVPAEMALARSAGSDDDARMALAVEFADRQISGVEALVGPDKRLTRVNVYSPDSAMGIMLSDLGQFDVAAFDGQRIAGKLFTKAPLQDARIRKSIHYDVTFSAPIDRSAK